MSEVKSGRGVFTAREFKFKDVNGNDCSWSGRGRMCSELTKVLSDEAGKGISVTADALAAHKQNKQNEQNEQNASTESTQNVATISVSSVKEMIAETVALASE